MATSRRLLIAASGTGGHVFPALAITEHLQQWQIEWLGVPDRMEIQLVQGRFPLHTLAMSGIQGPRIQAWAKALPQLGAAILKTRQILSQGKFAGVLAMGGYISAPAILAARSLGIPVILHESNAIPGKTTQWLGRLCQLVALGTDRTAKALGSIPTQVVGTPVRSSFWSNLQSPDLQNSNLQSHSGYEPLGIPAEGVVILVIGGSQGARGLNRMILNCASQWLAQGAWLVHLTGSTDAQVVADQAPDHPRYSHHPFWEDMAGLMQRATFAVSRSGAGTLAELAATHTPAILIPYPYAAEDHQYYNALTLQEIGAAEILRETQANQPILQELGLQWISDPAGLQLRRERLADLAVQEAGIRMAELIERLFGGDRDEH